MSLASQRLTPEQYLAIEREAEFKSEFYNGRMYAMSGASRRHNLIVTNLVREIGGQFKNRPCEVYSNDMRVKVQASGLYTYPDVVAVCGVPRFEDGREDTLLNPGFLVEVLSPSTEAYDRGEKFDFYGELPTLGDYVLVHQNRLRVEHFARQGTNRWLLTRHEQRDATLVLPGLDVRIPLAEIYAKVRLD